MYQASLDKYKRVRERVDKGDALDVALKAESMGAATYYAARKELKKNQPGKKTRLKRKQGNFIDVPLVAARSTKVAVVVCNSENLKDVLAGLQ